jgi:hypothetical protein
VNGPVLGLVGHGTDGSDGIEPGIHLRWAFRREVGFPPGGFCLYRGDARRPPLRCFAFGRVPQGERRRVTSSAGQLRVESERTMRVQSARLTWAPQLVEALRELGLPLPREDSSVVLRSRTRTRVPAGPARACRAKGAPALTKRLLPDAEDVNCGNCGREFRPSDPKRALPIPGTSLIRCAQPAGRDDAEYSLSFVRQTGRFQPRRGLLRGSSPVQS